MVAAAGAAALAGAVPGAAGAAETTARLSVTSAEQQANGSSFRPSVSGNGRKVAFESYASNLGASGDPAWPRLLVRDRDAGTTLPVDLNSAEEPADGQSYNPLISRNGRLVLFSANAAKLVPGDTNGRFDAFVRDVQAGTTVRASLRTTAGRSRATRAIRGPSRPTAVPSSSTARPGPSPPAGGVASSCAT